jgi:TolB-like protein/TolA-binding protein
MIKCCGTTLAVLCLLHAVFCAPVKISVLYFDNLSGDAKYNTLSKAFSEMMISDLSSIPGLVLIERENVEKVMKELALGLTGATDEQTSPKLGKLLGAHYLVSGNFVIVKRDITVNCKIIEVETAKIVKAGTIKGNARDALKLTSGLSALVIEGLKTALPGLGPSQAQAATAEVPIEKVAEYGEALNYRDNGDYAKAQQVLKSIVGEVPGFKYGTAALTLLEKRIAEYEKERQRLLDEQKAKPVTWQTFNQVTMNYMSSMKYSKLLAYCETLRGAPPQAPEGAMITPAEMIAYYIAFSAYSLKKWDRAITEGEDFLKKYPASMYFTSVKMYISQAGQEIKTLQTRIAQADSAAAPMLVKLRNAPDADRNFLLYQIANAYFSKQLYGKSLEYFTRINMKNADRNLIQPDGVLYFVFMCYYNLVNKAEASRVYATLQMMYPQSSYLSSIQSLMTMFPE